jgi:hypothetical protein
MYRSEAARLILQLLTSTADLLLGRAAAAGGCGGFQGDAC